MNPRDELPEENFAEDADSARLRALYCALPDQQPAAALDDAILAAARRATASRPVVVPVHWTRRWRVPLAAAATLLLAFGLLLQMPTTQQGAVPASVREELAMSDSVAKVNADLAKNEAARDLATGVAAAESLARRADPPAPAAAPIVAGHAVAVPDAAAPDAALPDAEQDDIAAVATAAEAKAETAATARQRADVAAKSAPAAPVPQFALVPRGAPWPLGLVPTLAPDTACARLTQESGGDCRARIVDGGLELRLTGGEPQWLYRLRPSLDELGWQEEEGAIADGARYSRRTTAGLEQIEWRPDRGAVLLRLRGAE